MASVAQAVQHNDASSPFTSGSITSAAGNRLVIATIGRSGEKPTAISDTPGNTWAEVCSLDDAGQLVSVSIWATSANALALAGGTFTLTGPVNSVQATFFELVGTGALDVSHTAEGSSTSISSGSSGAPVGSGGIAIGVGGNGFIFSDATYSSVAFTEGIDANQSRTTRSGFVQCTAGYRVMTTANAQTFSATGPNSGWASAIAIWKPVPSQPWVPLRQTTVAVHRATQR